MPDVLVTGLPRSGSTLVSALIDGLPDAVCLNEPAWQPGLLSKHTLDILPFCKWLIGDYGWTRQLLLNQEPVSDFRATDGSPVLDGLYDLRQKRNDKDEPESVVFARPDLSPDFILGMRHHTLYTSILPTLVKFGKLKIIAVIRHPFDVLNSWRQLPMPLIGRGKPHGIARFWPEALAITEEKLEAADMLVQLYDAYIQRYHELREHITIVKFEDVIDDPTSVSRLFRLEAASANTALIEKRARVLITAEVNVFRERLRKYGIYTKQYYPDI